MMKQKEDLEEELRDLGIITQDELIKAQDIYSALKAMKFNAGSVDSLLEVFLCPISKRLMVDPVRGAFVNNPDATPSVIKALDTGNAKTKVTAARILFNLNRVIIRDSLAVSNPFMYIIEVGDDLTAMMYAVREIFNMCMINKKTNGDRRWSSKCDSEEGF
ncbi:hypothetical protein GIB67_007522 [Kingdonia uniflora]|uniref:Uncharacterized protein n=1 Tax=Kingdonia uniflora TaxID=39325 RepID=A0A7J7LW81_9MAGN|nr:hypothetical protein GIB67_007522 [Kingdonia uniflora]